MHSTRVMAALALAAGVLLLCTLPMTHALQRGLLQSCQYDRECPATFECSTNQLCQSCTHKEGDACEILDASANAPAWASCCSAGLACIVKSCGQGGCTGTCGVPAAASGASSTSSAAKAPASCATDRQCPYGTECSPTTKTCSACSKAAGAFCQYVKFPGQNVPSWTSCCSTGLSCTYTSCQGDGCSGVCVSDVPKRSDTADGLAIAASAIAQSFRNGTTITDTAAAAATTDTTAAAHSRTPSLKDSSFAAGLSRQHQQLAADLATAPSSEAAPPSSSGTVFPHGIFIGATTGGFVVLLAVLGGIALYRKRKQDKAEKEAGPYNPMAEDMDQI